MRRTKEEAAATRRQILAAALDLFSEKGYAATTLSEIAGAAGVTRGAIYHHFDNKTALYQTLLEGFSGEFGQQVVRVRNACEFLVRAVALVGMLFECQLAERLADFGLCRVAPKSEGGESFASCGNAFDGGHVVTRHLRAGRCAEPITDDFFT